MPRARAGVGLLLGLLLALPAVADDYINTASIFEMGVSARVLGMGGAFLALADDEAAVFYNPAGLAFLRSPGFSSLYTRPFGTFSFGVLGAAERGWGMQLLILDSDTLEERDLYGNVIGSFRYTETGLVFGVGFGLGGRFALGLQAKVDVLLFPTRGTGLALSPCALFEQGSFTYGLVWRNLISWDLTYADGHTEPWIRDMAFGVSWQEGDSTICLDFTEHLITRGDIRCVRMGAEYTRFRPLVVRGGVNREGTTFGLSVEWRGIRLDFAYLLHRELPVSYVLAFSYRWSGSLIQALGASLRWIADLVF